MKIFFFLLNILHLLLLSPIIVSQGTDRIKLAYIYDGPVGDAGYTFSHNLARIELERANSNILYTTSYPSIDYGQTAVELMEDLITKNFSIIAFSSDGFLPSVEIVAEIHPEIFFVICDGGSPDHLNIAVVKSRVYEGAYLAGIVAGLNSKSGKLGYIGHSMGSTGRNMNAFAIGAHHVNPNITVFVDFIDTWYDETLEYTASDLLFSRHNVDVITQHTDSFFPMLAARNKGKYGIGWAIDMRPLVGPEVLTSVLLNYTVALQYQLNLYLTGQYANTSMTRIHWGVKEGHIQLAPFSTMFNADRQYDTAIYQTEANLLLQGNDTIFCGQYATLLNANSALTESGCLSESQIKDISSLLPFVTDITSENYEEEEVTDDSSSIGITVFDAAFIPAIFFALLSIAFPV